MKPNKRTPSTHLLAIARRIPTAPPIYRPQAAPKVLQTKAAPNRHAPSSFRPSPVGSNHNPGVIQRAEGKTHEQKKKEWNLRRMARANVSTTGNEELDLENERKANARLEATKKSEPILEALKKEPWASKRIENLSATVMFDINARRGQTDPGTNPTIRLGNEALTSMEMGTITLRHELDHAKLNTSGKKLKLKGFVAYYKEGGAKPKKDTFEYELEELIIRLRDWQRLKVKETIKIAEGYTEENAKERIREQYAKMLQAPDIGEYEPTEVQDVLRKLQLIANQLKVELK